MNKFLIPGFLFSCLFLSGGWTNSFLRSGYNMIPADTIGQTVPLGGNSWVTVKASGGKERVTNDGWINWEDTNAVFSTYVKLDRPGTINLYAVLGVPDGQSVILCGINKVYKEIHLIGREEHEQYFGTWEIASPGYIKIDMKGIKRTGTSFAQMKKLRIAGSAAGSNTAYIKNNEGNYFYWGRRGPSVHINYDAAETGDNAEWFYNEVTVPDGNDVIGSYFMADGFREGYFGMQVNSPTERHVLFSVWSPFQTDDPKSIPEDKKIILIKKGEGVHTGEFGNEGAGGQSYLNYDWKAGVTYRFLLHARPAGNDHTVFTAYFFTPETGRWNLIASFSRPETNTYLTRLHSFLENFEPSTGYITRKAFYGNQWVVDTKGEWKPLTKMVFTGDATAKIGYRMDYGGGEEGDQFFLRNCGFFNDNTMMGSRFEHKPSAKRPSVDLDSLN
ncbi:MAG: hypothetical protein B6D37_15415 [Sphingobacteriales bacterium UTBCD1]|nr:MAG: hypothetical protein B6D37_15415 [Sphingobacteriales bacterium UTBCD1]